PDPEQLQGGASIPLKEEPCAWAVDCRCRNIAQASVEGVPPQAGGSACAFSRRTNFWILPVEVFGSGPNTIVFGTLKWAMVAGQKAMMSSGAMGPLSGLRVTNAHGVSPHLGSERATTATSIT